MKEWALLVGFAIGFMGLIAFAWYESGQEGYERGRFDAIVAEDHIKDDVADFRRRIGICEDDRLAMAVEKREDHCKEK